MNTPKPIAIHLDRLAASLKSHGLHLKRTKILEVAAAAFGYHNTHECTAASQRGDLTPPMAEPIGRFTIPSGESLIILRDPHANAPYAVDESFIEQTVENERREIYGPTPYGSLISLENVADQPIPTLDPVKDSEPSQISGDNLCVLVEMEVDGAVTAEAVRSNIHQAIHHWRSNEGLSAEDDEGMIGEIMTHILPQNMGVMRTHLELGQVLKEAGRASIHVALIHHKHGIDIRLGTTLANVSRQVGDYVRENWDEAWQADQMLPSNERSDIPETPDELNDDQAEEKYFEVMGRFDASSYVDYSVISLDNSNALSPTPQTSTEIPPFPAVPSDLWEVFAARDGDTFREIFRASDDEDPEYVARLKVAKSFGLNLDDYTDQDDDHDFEEEVDLSLFDGDLDGIEVVRAIMDPSLQTILETTWEAAHRLPEGDPLRDRMIAQVMNAMPKA